MDATPDPDTQHLQAQEGGTTGPALVEDSLIDEVSIDGMCGVY